MFDRFFLAHPRTVGESYFEHGQIAARFGLTMIVGGAACLIHAAFPALFTRTASRRVEQLHAELTARRRKPVSKAAEVSLGSWTLDYQI